MRDAAGRSRCFAFLTFEDPASVNAVMVREHVLDGKIVRLFSYPSIYELTLLPQIDPKRAIPRQEHQRATKLFIGGLAPTVTSESMREFFSQFGKVIDSTVMLDRETGRSKGFGFVSFENTDVTPFLGFGNLEIDGKLVSFILFVSRMVSLPIPKIDVKLAQPRYQRDNQLNGEEGSQQGQSNGNFQGGQARFSGQQGNQFNMGGNTAGTGAGQTPFDPQALAALYTRMMQMAGGGMNPGMMGAMGAMNPMMGAMGAPGFNQGMRGMGMGMNMGMAGGMPGAMGAMGQPGMGGINRGMMQGGGGMGGNIPRGPRGAPGAQGGQGMPGNASVGPQRSAQRGQHNFHPYAR